MSIPATPRAKSITCQINVPPWHLHKSDSYLVELPGAPGHGNAVNASAALRLIGGGKEVGLDRDTHPLLPRKPCEVPAREATRATLLMRKSYNCCRHQKHLGIAIARSDTALAELIALCRDRGNR